MLAQNNINKKASETVENTNEKIYNYEIDFSLKNHVKDAFSNLIVTSIDSIVSYLLKSIFYFCIGAFISLIAFACFIFITLKHKPIEIPFVKTIIQNQIEEITDTKNVNITNANFKYDSNDNLVLGLDGLKFGNICCPPINLKIDWINSIKNTDISIDKIFLNNANFGLAMNDNSLNVCFYKTINTEKQKNTKKSILVPYNRIISLLNLVDNRPNFEVKKSTCNMEFENSKFLLNDFYVFVSNKDLSFPQKIAFKTKLYDSKKFTNVVVQSNIERERGKRTFDIDVSDLHLPYLETILKQSKYQKIKNISKIFSQYNVDISGHIKAIFNNDKLDTCLMNLKIGDGSIKHFLNDNNILKPWLKISKGNISIEYKNDICYVKDLYGNINGSNVRISGLEIPLNSTGNNQVLFNGTLEINNLSKDTLSLLPKEVAGSCIFLFNKTVDKLMIESLKLDINGGINSNNLAKKNNIKVSHGVFSIKNGEIYIGNDVITNLDAVGEVYKDSTRLKISKGNIGGITIKNGHLSIDKNTVWKGNLHIELPVHEFIKINENFAYLKHIVHPSIFANTKIIATISIDTTKRPDIISSIKSCRKCTAVSSKNAILDISIDKNALIAKGNISFGKFGMLNIDANVTPSKNAGYKIMSFKGESVVLKEFFPFIYCKSNGNVTFRIKETYNGVSGQIETNLSINNTDIKLPFVGDANFDNANITAKANRIGNIVNYNDILIENNGTKSIGYISYAEDTGEILGAKFANLNINNSDLSIDYHKHGDKMQLSLIGKNTDLSMLKSFIEKTPNNIDILTSVNIENIKFNAFDGLKKLHGTFTIRDKSIVEALAYAKLKSDTTIMIKTDNVAKKSLTITASDAGVFLRELGIVNDIIGGKLVIRFIPQEQNIGTSKKIYCELTDIVIENNKHVSKLLSLTVPNITEARNNSLGFNGIICSMDISDDTIKIDSGRAIGPTICISFDGIYDRKNDIFDIKGIAAPVLINNTNNISIYSPYRLTGGMSNIDIAVNPLNSSNHNILADIFGMNLNRNDLDYIPTKRVAKEETIIDLDEPIDSKKKNIRIDRRSTAPSSNKKSRKTVTHGITIERL